MLSLGDVQQSEGKLGQSSFLFSHISWSASALSVWLYAAQTFWLGSRAELFVSILLF